jgi:hypothetical protein
MTKIILFFTITFTHLFPINNNLNYIASFLDKRSFPVSGEFYSYDFANVPAHWDYVFKSVNGEILQLRGNPSTYNDLFGWKKVDITLRGMSDYYFIYLGDFDFDQDNRFDWILVQQSKQIAYKLTGVSSNNSFVWGNKIPVTFYISNNQVTFRKNSNIQYTPISPVQSQPYRPTNTTPITTSTPIPKIPAPSGNLEAPPTPPF